MNIVPQVPTKNDGLHHHATLIEIIKEKQNKNKEGFFGFEVGFEDCDLADTTSAE